MNSFRIFYSLLSVLFVSLAAAAYAQTDTTDVSTLTQNELYQYAEALRRGTGIETDLDQALELHSSLAQAGRIQSFARMGEIHIEKNQLEEALAAVTSGHMAGDRLATWRLATWHVQQRFGALSDPAFGLNQLISIAQDTNDIAARYEIARAYELGSGTDVQLDQSREIYQQLAAEGHGRSMQRLGEFERLGTFSDADPAAAANLYRSAAENGYVGAWLSLARVSLDMRDYQGAVNAYEAAILANDARAQVELARRHFLGELGSLSDRNLGATELKARAEGGDVYAAEQVLRLWERKSRRINELDLENVVEMLDAQMRAGDRRATSTLARAYRVLRWRIPQARARHAALVEEFGHQLGTTKVREQLFVAYDTGNHAQSREMAYDMVRELSGRDFSNGVFAIRSTDQNAFVYLIQRELIDLGYFDGPATSRFDTKTFRATMAFCDDRDIMENCQHGPLRRPAAVDIIRELTRARD